MAECHCSVMRIFLLDEHMAIESSHLADGKYTNASKGGGPHGKYFAFGYIAPEIAFTVAL